MFAANMSQPDLKIFLHIPKTAGTTLNQILRRQYDESETHNVQFPFAENVERIPIDQRAKFRFIYGHFPFGIHSHFPQSATYFTFFRHPVDRVLSLYYFAKENPKHYLHKKINEESLTLLDILTDARYPKEFNNGQVRTLSGVGPSIDFGKINNRHLENALTNVQRTMSDSFGLTERFDESLILLSERLGWRSCHYQRVNVTHNRASVSEIDDETQDAIEFNNQLDLALYEWVKQEFARRWGERERKNVRRLKRLKAINQLYSVVPVQLRGT